MREKVRGWLAWGWNLAPLRAGREWLARYFSGPNSWPFMLIGIGLVYWLAPRSWWPVLTFAFLGAFYIAWAVAWSVEYARLQRKTPALPFTFAFACFSLALILSALVVAPNPVTDFYKFRPWGRALWAVSLPSFAVAVYMECWRVYLRVKAQM